MAGDKMRSKKSDIWNHFHLFEVKDKARCNHCGIIISYTNSSASNLIRHLRRKHPVIVNRLLQQKSDETTDVNVKDLIRLVRRHRGIWQKNSLKTKNKGFTRFLWHKIGDQLNVPSHVARIKWDNLQRIYNLELKKTEGGIQSNWVHFNALRFLSGDVRQYDSSDTSDLRQPSITIRKLEVNEDGEVNITDSTSFTEELDYNVTNYDVVDLPMLDNNYYQQQQQPFLADDDESFFNSLLPIIRKFSFSDKLRLRNEFNDIVLQYVSQDDE